MRLDNFINEGVNVEQYLPHIKKKCGMAIKVMTSSQRLMFRGLDESQELVRKRVRKNRRPKDSWEEYSEYLDNALKEKFGWKPRSEGLFVSGNYMMASSYGHVHVIFPVGNFKYIWNTDYKDNLKLIGSRHSPHPKDNAGIVEPRIERSIMNNEFINNNINDALRKGHEIMIKCDEYFGIGYHWLDNNQEAVKKVFGNNFPTGWN